MRRGVEFGLVVACGVAALAAGQEGERQQPVEVRYQGDVPLGGLLFLPAGDGPFAGAVVVQGSGPGSRENRWNWQIAEAIRDAGLAVLVTDKRGSGAAGGDWRRAGFEELAADALAGVRFLAGRPEVDGGRVGLVGLSQGGWIVPLAAARSEEVAFVVDVSGAAVSFAEQSFHEMAATARQAGLDAAMVREVLELNREAGRYMVGGDWSAYETARRRAFERPWKEIAAGFPASPDDPIWTFLRKVAGFDPVPYWLLVEAPVLVVFGEEDEADNVPVAASVARLEAAFAASGHREHEVLVLPGLGHGLFDPETRELAAAFTAPLAAWLREVTAPADGSRGR